MPQEHLLRGSRLTLRAWTGLGRQEKIIGCYLLLVAPLHMNFNHSTLLTTNRVGQNQLYAEFSRIPRSHVRRVFASNKGLYVPAHIQLTKEMESPAPPFTLKTTKPNVSMGKGKQKEIKDESFEEERAWLLLKDVKDVQEASSAGRAPGDGETSGAGSNDPIEEEGGLECGCCFSPAPFVRSPYRQHFKAHEPTPSQHSMIQCPDAHLFCTECMVSYTSNLLGEHNFKIVCMDQSGCKLPFPESELKRFLTPKLLSLYEKVKQAKEIEMAGLDGLEECPHCDFKVVIENPSERLFRCQNDECGAVTCRECKRPVRLIHPEPQPQLTEESS